jgi:hypothetical protein
MWYRTSYLFSLENLKRQTKWIEKINESYDKWIIT